MQISSQFGPYCYCLVECVKNLEDAHSVLNYVGDSSLCIYKKKLNWNTHSFSLKCCVQWFHCNRGWLWVIGVMGLHYVTLNMCGCLCRHMSVSHSWASNKHANYTLTEQGTDQMFPCVSYVSNLSLRKPLLMYLGRCCKLCFVLCNLRICCWQANIHRHVNMHADTSNIHIHTHWQSNHTVCI